MALRKTVLDGLDYSEDYTGSFGSGARNVAVNRLARPGTLSPEAQARILGIKSTTSRQSAAQMADQNRFDRSFGFASSHPDISLDDETKVLNPKKPPTSVPVTPAMRTIAATAPTRVNPLNGLTAQPADPFADITLESRPPVLNTDITRPGPVFPVAPTPPVPPSRAQIAGQTTRRVLGNVLDAIPKDSMFGSTNYSAPPTTADKPIIDLPKIASNFWSGFTNPTPAPPTTAPNTPNVAPAGVTNATAAQFQKPTKDNPVPTTETTPETNIDRSQTSLAKFGLSEDELTRKKRLFAGF